MGIFKKFRGGYSHECVQSSYNDLNSGSTIYVSVPAYKATNGTSYNTIYAVTTTNAFATANKMLPYGNLHPVVMSTGLYESAMGLSYDPDLTYYNQNGDNYTVADMSGYTGGDTITDDVYYSTYDVEDYDVATGAVSVTPTISRAYSTTSKKAITTLTLNVENTTASDITIKSVKFWNKVPVSSSSSPAEVLKCAFYLSPSEYVTVTPGNTGTVVVALEYGEG